MHMCSRGVLNGNSSKAATYILHGLWAEKLWLTTVCDGRCGSEWKWDNDLNLGETLGMVRQSGEKEGWRDEQTSRHCSQPTAVNCLGPYMNTRSASAIYTERKRKWFGFLGVCVFVCVCLSVLLKCRLERWRNWGMNDNKRKRHGMKGKHRGQAE